MNTIRFLIHKIFYPASAIFVAIWLIICGIVDAVSDTVNINFSSSLMCFFIALAIAACNLILTKNTISAVGRYFLHMLASIVSISIVIAIFSTTFKTKYAITGNSFYLVLIFVVCYLVIATPAILLYFKKHRTKIENSEYQPIFRK